MDGRVLDYAALGVLIFVCLTFVYGIIYIHDIPYDIAKKRNHPHQDAIHTAGWVSLFLMHTIWPFLWIWATLYKPDIGWGIATGPTREAGDRVPLSPAGQLDELQAKITDLENQRVVQQDQHTRAITELTARIAHLEEQMGKEAAQ